MTESWNWKKFISGIDLINPISWAKFISITWKLFIIPLIIAGLLFFTQQTTLAFVILAVSIVLLIIGAVLNNRILVNIGILIIVIAGIIFFYGMYQGYNNSPVLINSSDIEFITPSGDKCTVTNNKIYCNNKVLTNKDIKKLEKIGLSLRPTIFIASLPNQPFGIGTEVFNLYKFNIDVAYFPPTIFGAGVSYDLINLKNLGDGAVGVMPTYNLNSKDLGGLFYLKWSW